MLKREGKDIALFKNRKYIDYVRGFHDGDYSNYWLGLENGKDLIGHDFRLLLLSNSDYCLGLTSLNATTEKLSLIFANAGNPFWRVCTPLSHRNGNLIIYKRSLCFCVDPLTKLIVTCSCNDKRLPKVTVPKWSKHGKETVSMGVRGFHPDIKYIGFEQSTPVNGSDLKAGSNEWPNFQLSYNLYNWDISVFANESVFSLVYRQHLFTNSHFTERSTGYEMKRLYVGPGEASAQHPFRLPFVASDHPRGSNIQGGYWTDVPVPESGSSSPARSCLLCSTP